MFLETKTQSEELPQGQRILLERLSHVAGFTVIVLRGPKSHPESVTRVARGIWYPQEDSSRADVQRRIDDWFAIANAATALNRMDIS